MGNKTSTLAKALLYILLFFTPLIFTTLTYESFELPKMTFVYIVGATVILLGSVGSGARARPFFWATIFVTAYSISTIFSIHIYTSLWGYYTRFNGGLMSVLIFFGVYAYAASLLQKSDYIKILKFGTLSVVPVSVYGLFQKLGITGNYWEADLTRIFSTFGQPNWLAAYIALAIPIILHFLIASQKPQKLFWSLLYVAGFSALWLTYSISGILGFVFGVAAFLWLNKKEILKGRSNALILLVLAFVTFTIALAAPGVFGKRLEDVSTDFVRVVTGSAVGGGASADPSTSPGTISPDVHTYNLSDPGYIRSGLWKGALKIPFSNPKNFLVGTGPETFAYAFPPFRPAELNYTSEWDFVFNKPHNYYLEIFTNLGIAGLIPYMIIVAYTIKRRDPLLTPALISLHTTNVFGWPTVATSLLFWYLLAGFEIKSNA